MTRSQSFILAGATGLVGGLCLDRSLADEAVARVTVVGRRTCGHDHERLQELLTDFESLGSSALPKADACLCCLGTTIKKAGSKEAFRRVDLEYVELLARQAATAGVANFLLVSSVGADADSSIFYQRIKGEAEAAVSSLPFHSVHILRPSLLLGRRDRADSRPGESLAQTLSPLVAPLIRGRWARYRPMPAVDLAAELVRLAKLDDSGRFIHESGIQGAFFPVSRPSC